MRLFCRLTHPCQKGENSAMQALARLPSGLLKLLRGRILERLQERRNLRRCHAMGEMFILEALEILKTSGYSLPSDISVRHTTNIDGHTGASIFFDSFDGGEHQIFVAALMGFNGGYIRAEPSSRYPTGHRGPQLNWGLRRYNCWDAQQLSEVFPFWFEQVQKHRDIFVLPSLS